MKLNIRDKEYTIKFGYKPTLKGRIISKVVKMAKVSDEDGNVDMEKIEDMLLFLPEFLLVGLQVHHEDFRYDYDTEEGKKEQLDKATDLVEQYFDNENSDIMALFNGLQEALTQDSFLSSLHSKEKKAQEAEDAVAVKAVEETTEADVIPMPAATTEEN